MFERSVALDPSNREAVGDLFDYYLGAPGFLGQFLNKNKYRYHDVDLNSNIEHAYQALAIDERRRPVGLELFADAAVTDVHYFALDGSGAGLNLRA